MANANPDIKSFIEYMKRSEDHAHHGFQLLLERPEPEKHFDALKTAGLFDPSNNSGPVPVAEKEKEGMYVVPFWVALPYLQAVSNVAGKTNSIDLAKKILNVVREVSNERINGKPKDNYHTWRVFIEILGQLPINAIEDGDIDLLTVWLQSDFAHGSLGQVLGVSLLPKWLSNSDPSAWQKACRVLQHCLTVKWVNKSGRDNDEQPISVIEDYWLNELVKNNVEPLGQKCPVEASTIFLDKLREVYSRIEKRLPSWTARPAIEPHPQNYSWKGLENSLVDGVRDVAVSWLDSNPIKAKPFVISTLKGSLEIERRLGIYLVNYAYDRLGDLTESVIALILNSSHLHELFAFLRDRFTEFSEDQKKLVLDTIAKIPAPDREEGDLILKGAQRNWLTALQGKGYAPAEQFYKELNLIPELGKPSPHPDFISWMETRHGFGPSEYSVDDLIAFVDDGSLIRKLNEFKPGKEVWLDTPTVKSLTDTLTEAVVKEPLKFRVAIPEFLKANSPYQYGVISGFKKLWDSETKPGDDWIKIWEHLLSFFHLLIDDEGFWNTRVENERDLTPTKDWLVTLIADFLRAGVKKDEKAINEKFLPSVEDLIFRLVARLPSDWSNSSSEPLTQAMNTQKGRAIEALIDYSLFIARASDKKNKEHESSWNRVVKVFDEQLVQCKGSNQAFSSLMGAYAANLEYLSFEWLTKNIRSIFPVQYPENFACAFGGLAYSAASKRLFILLRDTDIIKAALEDIPIGAEARKNLIERIAISYLWGDEELDSKLFSYLFRSDSENDLSELARFFWSIRKQDLLEKQIVRVVACWKKLGTWVKDKSPPPEELLSTMGLLISYLDVIDDDDKQRLIMSASYVAKKYNSDLFLSDLDRLAPRNPNAVKDILIKLLETYVPSYDFENRLLSITKTLVSKGLKAEMLPVIEKLKNIKGFRSIYDELTTSTRSGS